MHEQQGTTVTTFSREIVEVILKGTEPKEWKNDQIFSKKTLMLLVEKMPGKDDTLLGCAVTDM